MGKVLFHDGDVLLSRRQFLSSVLEIGLPEGERAFTLLQILLQIVELLCALLMLNELAAVAGADAERLADRLHTHEAEMKTRLRWCFSLDEARSLALGA